MHIVKKAILVSMCCATLLSVPAMSRAASVNVGAATWFAWWSPSFLGQMTGENRNDSYAGAVWYRLDPAFLMGPALSVSFSNRWSFSTVFLYGSWYRVKTRSVIQETSSTSIQFIDADIKKWDLDTLVNYALFDFLKVFAGVKWQGYIYHVDIINASNNVSPGRLRVRSDGIGPGLGFALTVSLGADFFLLWNASALYLYSTIEMGVPQIHRQVYSAFGCNTTLSVAWHLESASTTISLGFRYQYLDYRLWAGKSSDWTSRGGGGINLVRDGMIEDHFYGLVLSAVYSFNL